jgi:hypothetical protein
MSHETYSAGNTFAVEIQIVLLLFAVLCFHLSHFAAVSAVQYDIDVSSLTQSQKTLHHVVHGQGEVVIGMEVM